MRLYETAFILNPQTDDATIDRQVKTVATLITDNGGKIINEDRMGTRRMAFPIEGLHNGYYAALLYEAGPEIPARLERLFHLDEAYVRHLTILFDGNPEQVREQQRAMASSLDAEERERMQRQKEAAERRRSEGGGRRDRYDRGERGDRGDRGDRGPREPRTEGPKPA